jgi:hypothetical protein
MLPSGAAIATKDTSPLCYAKHYSAIYQFTLLVQDHPSPDKFKGLPRLEAVDHRATPFSRSGSIVDLDIDNDPIDPFCLHNRSICASTLFGIGNTVISCVMKSRTAARYEKRISSSY